jgi:hypothetical protein
MSRFIRVATGLGPEEFAMQALFEPLGIGNVHWEVYSEQGMGNGITDWANPDGEAPLGFGLWLTARDMLKIGQLYLDGGVYNGRRILDESWIEAAWTRYSHSENSAYFPESGWGHGYQWWVARLTDLSGREFSIYFASGWGSQVIFIVPDLGLVVVATGDNYDYNGPDVDALLVTGVLPNLTPEMDARFSGSWYDPDTTGQGLNLEVIEHRDVAAGYWYTYTPSGELRWFVYEGSTVGDHADVTIYAPSGGIFLQDDRVDLDIWGSGRFKTVDCMHMEFSMESAEVSTTIPLTRLTGVCAQWPE